METDKYCDFEKYLTGDMTAEEQRDIENLGLSFLAMQD